MMKIIDYRYQKGKPILFTSNLTISGVGKRLNDEAIDSRIEERSLPIHFKSEIDRRRKGWRA